MLLENDTEGDDRGKGGSKAKGMECDFDPLKALGLMETRPSGMLQLPEDGLSAQVSIRIKRRI